MGRQLCRLSALTVSKASAPGMMPDGGGLYLQVSPSGSKSWIYRYAHNARERQMGLGPFPDVSLQEARNAAAACRAIRREGNDPLDVRMANKRKAVLDA